MTRSIDRLPPQIRAVAGVLIAVPLGFTTMMLIRGLLPYQPPAGIGAANGLQYNRWVESLPQEAYVYMLAAFLASAVVAGAVAGYFVLGTRYKVASVLSGFLLMILAIGNFLAFNHPEWLTYSACIGFLVFGWLGGALVRKIASRV
jgi:hypothetical protein